MEISWEYDLPRLQAVLVALLQAAQDGLGEYELIKELQRQAMPGFPPIALLEPLPLFRMHFLLFHALYCLQTQCWQQGKACIEITPLRIRWHPYQPGNTALVEPDPVRAYYLDARHLTTTTEAQVKQRLTAFWAYFHAPTHRQQALAVLGLHDPVNTEEIKQRYRELAMRHHPDRGGDAQLFVQIQQAMALLKNIQHS